MPDPDPGSQSFRPAESVKLPARLLGLFQQARIDIFQVPLPPLGIDFIVELFQPGIDDMQGGDLSRPGQTQ